MSSSYHEVRLRVELSICCLQDSRIASNAYRPCCTSLRNRTLSCRFGGGLATLAYDMCEDRESFEISTLALTGQRSSSELPILAAGA